MLCLLNNIPQIYFHEILLILDNHNLFSSVERVEDNDYN